MPIIIPGASVLSSHRTQTDSRLPGNFLSKYPGKIPIFHETRGTMLPSSLPMTHFEEYMLLDGTDTYPMECHCRYRFSGEFDRDQTELALAEALASHPLFYAVCRETKKYRYAWEFPKIPERLEDRIEHGGEYSRILGVRLYWLEGICRDKYPEIMNEPLSLFSEPMLRLYIVEEKDAAGKTVRSDFIIKCHHSAGDGKGFGRFFLDFLISYARSQGIELPEWQNIPKTVPARLAERGWFGRSVWQNFLQVLICTMHLPRSLRLITHSVQPIVRQCIQNGTGKKELPIPEDSCPPKGAPCILFRKLPQDRSAAILQKCRDFGCTFNDILLQAVWAGTKEWRLKNPELAYEGRRKWFRISVPMDLRVPGLENMPACNIVSMLFCDRKWEDVDLSASFRNSIHREMMKAKKYSLGFLLIQSMRDARFVCGHLHDAVKLRDCWASMVLTNIGPMFPPKFFPFPRNENGELKIGSLVLEEIDSASPIRSLTNASICCTTYAGRLQFSMIYDSRSMQQETADEYFDTILAAMWKICDVEDPCLAENR